LPNLAQLISEGAMVDIEIYGTTDTKAGWSQILTGCNPEITGVYSNGRYAPIPKGYSVFERLEAFFGRERIFTAAVIGKKGHVDADAPQRVPIKDGDEPKRGKQAKKPEGTVVIEDGVKYRVIPGKPYYHTQHGMDVWENGLLMDWAVGRTAVDLVAQHKDERFFLFVHFAETDHKGHNFGENSRQYNDALVSADAWTGRIMDALKEFKLYDETLIYVTADHGFDEGQKSHRNAPHVFLATNDPRVALAGTRADIAPTMLARFGVDVMTVEPPLSGKPLLAASRSAFPRGRIK
jgi:hypothetical protein